MSIDKDQLDESYGNIEELYRNMLAKSKPNWSLYFFKKFLLSQKLDSRQIDEKTIGMSKMERHEYIMKNASSQLERWNSTKN